MVVGRFFEGNSTRHALYRCGEVLPKAPPEQAGFPLRANDALHSHSCKAMVAGVSQGWRL